MRPLIASLIIVLAAAVPAEPAQIESPLRIASQAPLQSLRLGLLPVVPGELEEGEVRVGLAGTWTNVWINDRPNLLLDYEALDSRLTVGWALSRETQLEIAFEERSGFGGLLDPFIQNFHDRIGNGLNGRDSVPRGTVNIEVRNPQTGEIVISRRDIGPFSRGLSMTVSRTSPSRFGRLAYATTLRVPLKHAGDEWSSAPDLGVSAAWSRNIGGRSVHLGGGLTRFGADHLEGLSVLRYQRTGFAAVVQPLTPRTSVVVQYLFNEGAAETGALGRNAHELTLGGRVYLARGTAVEIGLIENFINYDNGPDFGVHIGISRTLR